MVRITKQIKKRNRTAMLCMVPNRSPVFLGSLIVLSLLVAGASPALAVPPNDTKATATVVASFPFSASSDLASATSGAEDADNTDSPHTVWYAIQAQEDVQLLLEANSDYSIGVNSIRGGVCCGTEFAFEIAVEGGDTTYLQFFSEGSDAGLLHVNIVPVPAWETEFFRSGSRTESGYASFSETSADGCEVESLQIFAVEGVAFVERRPTHETAGFQYSWQDLCTGEYRSLSSEEGSADVDVTIDPSLSSAGVHGTFDVCERTWDPYGVECEPHEIDVVWTALKPRTMSHENWVEDVPFMLSIGSNRRMDRLADVAISFAGPTISLESSEADFAVISLWEQHFVEIPVAI